MISSNKSHSPSSDLEQLLEQRHINFNDVHFAQLEAIVEAQSSFDAVMKFLSEKMPTPQNADRSEPEPIAVKELGGLTAPDLCNSGETAVPIVTELKINIHKTSFRNHPENAECIDLANYRISLGSTQKDKLVWVYRLGTHWVICG